MADLLAIISLDRRAPIAPDAIASLVDSYVGLRGEPRVREDLVTSGCAVTLLGHLETPVTGVEREGGRWAAWAGPRAPGPALDPLAGLGGQFAIVRGGGATEEVVVATDRLGLKPLYMTEAAGRLFVSTSALVLARHLRLSPSRQGLQFFLRTGNQFGRLTPWEGLRRLLPAEAIHVGDGAVTETYWQPAIEPALRQLDFDDCAAACIERDLAAITDRFGGESCWIDLTGGFDSRLLALLADRARVAFRANTAGPSGSEDVVIAERIAAAAGWRWRHVALPADWDEKLTAEVESAVAWGDCHLDATLLAEVAAGHRDKRPDGEVLLNGGGGEHLRDYPWGHELWRANRSRKVDFDRLIAWRVLGPLDTGLFREDPTRAAAAAARRELEFRVAPFADASNTFQDDLLYALKATGHFGAFQAAAGAEMRLELPFYDHSVFTTAISAAPRHRSYHRLMRAMIHRLDPAIAALPTETGGPAEPVRPGNLHRFTPYVTRRAARFGARLRGRLWSAPGAPAPALVARAALVGRLRVEGRLDPARMRSAALYDPERLEATLVAAALTPATVDWTALGRILTVELALAAVDAGID